MSSVVILKEIWELLLILLFLQRLSCTSSGIVLFCHSWHPCADCVLIRDFLLLRFTWRPARPDNRATKWSDTYSSAFIWGNLPSWWLPVAVSFLLLPLWQTASEEMPLLILKPFNASYYCVKQFSYTEVKATKRKKKEVGPVIDTSIVPIQVRTINQTFSFSSHNSQTARFC